MTIRFIKILAYQTKPARVDGFKFASKILNQSINPPTLQPKGLKFEEGMVLYSKLRRARGCLLIQQKARGKAMKELNELPFNLKKFCSKKIFEQKGSQAVRQAFVAAFIDDDLLISRAEICKQTRTLLKYILRASQMRPVSIISHSFRLSLLKAFIETKGKIEKNPQLIKKFILPHQKTFEFGKGFAATKQTIQQCL